QTSRSDERKQLVDGSLRRGNQLSALWMIVQHAAPDLERRLRRIDPRGCRRKLRFGPGQLALPDREHRARWKIDQLFGAVAGFDICRADSERGGRRRKPARFEILRVR